jgi:hypothetical protein
MGTVEAEIVYTRDRSNGRVHARYRVAGGRELATREGCNLDQAGAFDVISADQARETNVALLCANDFPDGPASIPAEEPV